jgi:hypothetical protein
MMYALALLASYGLCFALMNDKVVWLPEWLRSLPLFKNDKGHTFFARMLVCPFCTGFHTGWLMWLAISWDKLAWAKIPEAFLFALASSAWCYVVDTAAQWLESNTPTEG